MIKVYSGKIIVTDYEIGDNENIELALSYWDKALFTHVMLNGHYDSEKRCLFIPKGYSIPKLENELNTGVEYRINEYNEYDKIIFTLKTKPRDKNQTTALSFLAGVNGFEAYSSARRKMLQLGTGIGKTYVSIAIMWYFKLRGAIIMNKDGLIEQWKEKIMEYTNIISDEIFIIKGTSSIEKILKMNEDDKKRFDSIKVFLISHGTITSYANMNSWDSVTDLFKILRVGINIIDEAHLAYKNILMIDFYTNVYRTIYLTATAGKSDINQNKLYVKAFSNLPTLTIKNSQENSNVVTNVITYKTKPTLQEVGLMSTMRGINRNFYVEYSVRGKGRELFFKCMKLILNTFKDKDGSMAFLLLRKFAVYDMQQFIIDEFPELKDDIGIYISDIPKKEREEQLKKKIILSTSSSFGTGIDVKDLYVLVNTEPGSSKIVLEQNFGRLRNKGYYFEVYDKGIIKRNNQFNMIREKLKSLSKRVTIREMV